MATKEKKRKLVPYSPAWEREANQLARSFCPTIYPCGTCNGAVIKGYCCTGCGSPDPRKGRNDDELE